MSYEVYDIGSGTLTGIHTKLRPIIEPIWKSVIPEGTVEGGENYTLLKIDGKLAINTCTQLPSPYGIDMGCYLATVLTQSVLPTSPEKLIGDDVKWAPIYAGYYGAYAYSETTDVGDKYMHVVIGKQKKTIALGISDDPSRICLTVLASKLEENEFVGIQFRCMSHRVYESGGNKFSNDHADYNYRWDTYTKDYDHVATTQRMYGCGLYTSSKLLTIVPAIDPWRDTPIPDAYISVCGPLDMAGLDGKILINGRTFVTGHVNSYVSKTSAPMKAGSIADGGICTFIEI